MSIMNLIIFSGILSIIYGFWAGNSVLKSDPGNEKMQEISSAIQVGAQAYLNRQYTTIAIVGLVICVLLYLFFQDVWVIGGYLIGAILSGAAGYIGMIISVRANVRTAQAANESQMDASGGADSREMSCCGVLELGEGLVLCQALRKVLGALCTKVIVVQTASRTRIATSRGADSRRQCAAAYLREVSAVADSRRLLSTIAPGTPMP